MLLGDHMVAKSAGKNETGCGRNAQRHFSYLSGAATVKQSWQFVYILKSEHIFISTLKVVTFRT